MRKTLKKPLQHFSAILLVALLAACGGDSSSNPATTAIPTSATIFYAHNLVLTGDSLLATGYNAFGQLGTGDLLNRTIFSPVIPRYSFRGFATGGDHSIAFTNSSTVYTWGYNSYGQLGANNITKTHSSIPLPLSALSGIKAVAAGAYHTLALKNDDSLWAWGSNDHGQVGQPVSVSLKSYFVPQQVSAVGFVNISSITANGKHSLAVADGRVWGWGINTSGQLGVESPSFFATPTMITGLPDGIAAIAAGGGFSYALAKDGTLWAWGNNSNGQLGDNTYTTRFKPVQVVTENGPLLNVVRIAAGIQHGLALLSDGTVWAWGYNHFGQLGNNSTQDRSFAVKARTLPGATEIRAFGSSSMAKIGNDWYAWGDNTYGQLGLSPVGSVQLPRKVVLGF